LKLYYHSLIVLIASNSLIEMCLGCQIDNKCKYIMGTHWHPKIKRCHCQQTFCQHVGNTCNVFGHLLHQIE
jgi:hypothetical protein